ncbi:MAG: rod-binding protein [Polyangiaceae bacterium]
MINPIGPIGSSAAQGVAVPPKAEAPDPAMLKAAKDFESIFVRQMLKSVEKTTAAGMGTKPAAGQSTYGSMVVDTLSDSISKGGGLGLADVIAKSMMAAHPGLKSPGAAAGSTKASQAPLIPTLKAPK